MSFGQLWLVFYVGAFISFLCMSKIYSAELYLSELIEFLFLSICGPFVIVIIWSAIFVDKFHNQKRIVICQWRK